ncbi:helix-turn-helix transcriptional regulator, partial [uncultured Duncaniella sp.]
MDLVSRLKQYLNTRGISITQFADECDIPRPSASQLLAGRNKKVSDEIIGKIHYTYPELSVSWLMFG